MASSTSRMVAGYSKSNRSTCKKCYKVISANVLRLGLVTRDTRGFDMTRWHHLDCFPLPSASGDVAEVMEGFSVLKQCDQEAIRLMARHAGEALEEMSSLPKKPTVEIPVEVSDIKDNYKDAVLLPKWKAFQTLIFLERDEGLHDSKKIAAFDFDGCLAKTSVGRIGANAWSLMHPSIPGKLKGLYSDGYKLVIFSNEANIEKWKNKRQMAIDSKIGRLNNFINHAKVPIQVFIACGEAKPRNGVDDPFRKPKPGMWHIMEQQFNSGLQIDMDQSFYVGDAAGRLGDHSDADIKFAQAIGLKFYVPEEYFGA